MKKSMLLPLLACLLLFTCGFTWPFGNRNECSEAGKRLSALPASSPERGKEEETILKLCPEGPAGYMIRAMRFQREGNDEKAMANLREAVKRDDSFSEAHGNLGLLLARKGAYEEASVELFRALMGKADPRYHQALAQVLLKGKVYPLALYNFQEALKAYPGDEEIVAGMAECQMNLGRLADAERSYRNIMAADNANVNARLGLVEVFRKGNRLDDAAGELQDLIRTRPEKKELHRMLGEVLQEKGDREEAKKEYKLAGIDIMIDPADYVRKGDELQDEKSYDRAATAYRAASAAMPGSVEVVRKLGDAEMAAGNDDAALAAFRKAAAMAPRDGEMHHKAGLLLERRGMLDEAVKEYVTALERNPDDSASRSRLAEISFARGDFRSAVDHFRQLLRVRPDNPILHLKLAKALDKSKDFKGAIGEYVAALKIDGDNLEAHRELAALYAKRGMHEGAEAQWKEVLRLKRDETDARLALTALYVKKKRYDDLLSLLKEGAEINPADANAHYKLGLLYEFRKEYDAALAEYQRTVELQSDHPKGLNALGRMYLKSGRAEEARKYLEAAKKADPTFAEPVRLLASVREDLAPPVAKKEVTVKKARKTSSKKKVSKKAPGKKTPKKKKKR